MKLRLYNTLARAEQDFAPIEPDHVRMYVCGPTVYDRIHIGNARPLIVFDVLYRLLRHLYPRVTYVRNITDVEDKIIDRARERDEPIEDLTGRTLREFHEDAAALGLLPPDFEPRATDNIAGMIALIAALIERGHAYAAEGNVLFHVPSMADYGRLSRRPRDEQIAGARVEVAPYKRDPADFVLWKPSAPDQPGWDSPWGRGRPGWHIECSAMSMKYLGDSFDIHGGGQDLIFPHHENEIAQTCGAHGLAEMARYWLHNGFVTAGGAKMAKSEGNFVTLADALTRAPGEAIRLWMLGTHYRAPLDFSDAALRQAKGTADRFYGALQALDGVEAAESEPPAAVVEAACDDLNTPKALAAMHALADTAFKADGAARPARLKGGLLASASLLGLLQDTPNAWFRSATPRLDAAVIEARIVERGKARSTRDFARADAIRAELTAAGVELMDGPDGTTWRRP